MFFEFLRMFKIDRNQMFIPVILGMTQFVLLYFLNFENYLLSALVFSLCIVLFLVLIKVSSHQMAGVFIGLLIALFIFPHLLFIRETVFGIKALVFLVVITELNDVFQYLMGKFFGRHKITPKISPNKTWEGFIGGVVTTTLLATVLAPFLTILTWQQGLVAGFIIACVGFIGDVVLSSIKRDLGIKDTGSLIPGHGGLLDRMDSLMYSTPLFFHYFYYITKDFVG